MTDSRISGFYRMCLGERIDALAGSELISHEDAQRLRAGEPLLNFRTADRMIENVVAVFGLPLAVATNLRINGKDCLAPMVVEEPSIVAGVSGAARLMRSGPGIESRADEPILIGQIQLCKIADVGAAVTALRAAKQDLLELSNQLQPRLVERGGGLRDIELHRHAFSDGSEFLVVHLLVDTRDAMGANLVNSLCERLAPEIEKISGAGIGLRILSNLADRSLVTASVTLPASALAVEAFTGDTIRDGIVAASEFAAADPYRAATHNKGIMNGIDAVALATGNDWRAIEAAAHAYAAHSGVYRPLTNWAIARNGDLRGDLCLPLKVGTVGGSLLSNPGAALGLRIAGVDSAQALAELMGAVGLAQNFAALRALAGRGIQEGHMRLHARSVAASVQTPEQHFEAVVEGLIDSGEIKQWKARELSNQLRHQPAVSGDTASVSASGKVILLGEHAAVYGKHVLALPIRSAMTASAIATGGGVRLLIREWNFDKIIEPGAEQADGAAAIVAVIVNELGLQERGCEVSVSTKIPAAVGLGSSAALATVITRAVGECFELRLDDAAVNRIAFACEQKTHGDPSGVDNTIAVFERPVLFCKGSGGAMRTLDLRNWPPLVIGISGSTSGTLDQVSRVRAGYAKNKNLYTEIFDQIDRLSLAGAEVLLQENYETLGAMMNVCQGLLNAIQVSTPELERMVDTARRHGATGAKLTGAGGGGAVVALCPGREQEVALAWREAGYDVLQLTGSTEGNVQHR